MQFHHLQSLKLAKWRTLSFNKFCFVQFSFKVIWREMGLEMVSGTNCRRHTYSFLLGHLLFVVVCCLFFVVVWHNYYLLLGLRQCEIKRSKLCHYTMCSLSSMLALY